MIKLLIVDDSALMRRVLRDVFTPDAGFETSIARNGLEGLAAVHEFHPDVVTLDVNMPELDGLACLDRIMLERPCPVIMVSSLTEAGAETTLRAIEIGAVDFVAKPAGAISLAVEDFAPDLLAKVRAAAGARLRRSVRLSDRVRLRSGKIAPQAQPAARVRPVPTPRKSVQPVDARPAPLDGLVLVGCSTGGPPALDELLGALPAGFPWPVVVAQHMPGTFTGPLARRLDGLCALDVVEVTGPTPLAAGTIYIGKGDADLVIGARPAGLVALPVPESPDFRWHPSVDRLVDSALARAEASRLVGVLMTGMGNDGAAAMTRLREAGGRTIAEAEETAVVWGMPGELVRMGGAEFVAPLERIASKLLGLAARP